MDPFIGEIRLFAFDYPPPQWAICDGSSLPIAQNQALFVVIGTQYGGDGITHFNLPDLRGRVPIHTQGKHPGTAGGEARHALNSNEIPAHKHSVKGSESTPNQGLPTDSCWTTASENVYKNASPNVSMVSGSLATSGTGQPHENRAPFLVLNYCIAIDGGYAPPPAP